MYLKQYRCHESRPWTLLHSPPDVTLPSQDFSHSYRSLKDYIPHHPLHQHSCLHWSRTHLNTISQSSSPNHTHTHTLHKPWTFSHSLPSIVSQLPFQSVFLVSLVCFPVFRFRPCPWIILSALPSGLSLPIADPRLPKDYSSVLSMPYPFAPARPCLYWPWC